jgi:hypothetical protein
VGERSRPALRTNMSVRAGGLLRMMETGRLTLHAPVADFLPADLVARLVVIDGVSYGHEVTVRPSRGPHRAV